MHRVKLPKRSKLLSYIFTQHLYRMLLSKILRRYICHICDLCFNNISSYHHLYERGIHQATVCCLGSNSRTDHAKWGIMGVDRNTKMQKYHCLKNKHICIHEQRRKLPIKHPAIIISNLENKNKLFAIFSFHYWRTI